MVNKSSTPEFYDAIFREKPHKWENIHRDYLAFNILSQWTKEPVTMLDYGCGNGHTIALFHSQWPDTFYTGVDISTVALDLARKRNTIPTTAWYTQMPSLAYLWDVIT